MAKKFFLIDGSALFYRSYFAFIRNPLINSKGENTSASFGFLNALFRLIEDENPDYLAVIFDTKEPTFRHKMYDQYKANRESMPEDMSATYPRLREVLNTLQLPVLEMDGFEADDIIATLVERHQAADTEMYIISGDKDLAQLVSDHTFIYTIAKNMGSPPEIYGAGQIKEKYGIHPHQIIDWLSLMGDSSDNVPGVPSVGPKTAVTLLEEYENLDNIYANIENITRKSVKEKLATHKDQAYLSQKLVTLDRNVPIEISDEKLTLTPWDQRQVEVLLKDMEFNRLVVRAEKINQLIAGGRDERVELTQPEVVYQLVETEAELNLLIREWQKHDEFVFDLETDSLDVLNAQIAGIALSFSAGRAWYISLNHIDSTLDSAAVLERIKPFFADVAKKKMAQNIKFDAMILEQHGVPVNNLYFDTMIASYLINSSASQHNLDALASQLLNYKMIPITEIIGTGRKQVKMTELPGKMVRDYACEDADITFRLKKILHEKLRDLQLEKLFFELEMPLVRVLMQMEEQGVRLDIAMLSDLSEELGKQISGLEKQIYGMSGEEFNINSPQQLGVILFDKMEIHKELRKKKPPKTKTGQYSTAENVLERFGQHPLVRNLLDYRKLTKLKSTYIDALPDLVNEKTGRVHTSYNQSVAATGRLSSSNPNLQNIPIRTELGREIRRAFIPSREGYVMLSADYSQIELRIMAHLSGDQAMQESFRLEQDIHTATAARIFSVELDEVNSDMRRKAKEINFGIIYGMSKYGLANRLEIDVDEAESFIFEYFATYPGIQDFMRNTVQLANSEGYVKTMLGRIRYLPQIHSDNRQLREFAERTSINTPIQGSAADLIKIAMCHISDEMRTQNLKSKMLLQVHDELVFEVPENEVETMKFLVRSKMEQAMELDVPLRADIGVGDNWLEAH
jgi:DNA polymerase-1